MWGGAIKIGVRPFSGRGVFVLVISNINIGFQKSLTLPLRLVLWSRVTYYHKLPISLTLAFTPLIGTQMPPRPSSVQSDGVLHSSMGQDRGESCDFL